MPNTYATVITDNLNQKSGDLNVHSSMRKTNQSSVDLPQIHGITTPKVLGSTVEVGDELTGISSHMGSTQAGPMITKPKNVLM